MIDILPILLQHEVLNFSILLEGFFLCTAIVITSLGSRKFIHVLYILLHLCASEFVKMNVILPCVLQSGVDVKDKISVEDVGLDNNCRTHGYFLSCSSSVVPNTTMSSAIDTTPVRSRSPLSMAVWKRS